MINEHPIVERSCSMGYADIYIAGSVADAVRACRKYCTTTELCVHVVPMDFVYTGGVESGVKIGLINYPRFPAAPRDIFEKAVTLAKFLIHELYQGSACVQGSCNGTVWLTRRGDAK